MESRKALIFRIFLFLLGLTAMATQVIMIRESLAIFSGNELVIGLFLGLWMLLTAAGSFLAVQRFHLTPFTPQPPIPPLLKEKGPGGEVKRYLASLLILLSILPLTTLYLIILLRYTIVASGIMPGPGQTILVISLALLPFCMVSGMLFPVLAAELSASKGRNMIHEAYALDSAGSMLGGLLFSLFFIFVLPPYESLLLLTIICLAGVVAASWINNRKLLSIGLIPVIIIIIILDKKFEPARILDKLQFHKQEVLEIKSSPYGMMAVTSLGDQVIIYENGVQVISGDDPVYREESVHYAMLLHPAPKKVLLLSGGFDGIIEEILKYDVEKVSYVESDRWLLNLMDKYRKLPVDHRVHYFFEDPRIFISTTDDRFDIILLNTPEPNSAAMNRFYTVEFYRLLKERLNPGGIISMNVPAAGNYLSENSRQVHSVNYNSLRSVCNHVRIIPGGKDYFLASDSTLERSVFRDYPGHGFTNLYVDPSYINEDLLKMRSDLISKELLADAPVNSDMRPFIFFVLLKQWQERYKINNWLIPLILILLLIMSLILLGPLNLGLFTGGFTASGLEFILLLWFQVIYGYVYQMTGVIFAVFMAGIVIGSLVLGNRYRVLGIGNWVLGIKKKNYTYIGFLKMQGVFALFSTLIALLILLFSSSPFPSLHAPLPPGLLITLIFILVMITGLLMGLQFFISAQLRKEDIGIASGQAFSADLFGSAVGIILVSVYLVPLLGLPVTGLLLAGLNLLAVAVMHIKR